MSFNGERAESAESVFFWFFNSSNFEMGVKMVDACVAPFNRYWVFVSGLTSQEYRVRVTKMVDRRGEDLLQSAQQPADRPRGTPARSPVREGSFRDRSLTFQAPSRSG